MSKQIIEAFWRCPYCSATAKDWRRRMLASHNARCHISKFHREERNRNPKPSIIETRKIRSETL
jgi:hypothetical protein